MTDSVANAQDLDLSEIQKPGDGSGSASFEPVPEDFLERLAAERHDTSVIPPEIREHLPYRIAAGGRPAFDEAGK